MSSMRTVSPAGGPAPSAACHTTNGASAIATTTSRRGGRHPLRIQAAIATKADAPMMSTHGPPPEVIHAIGAFASVEATTSR